MPPVLKAASDADLFKMDAAFLRLKEESKGIRQSSTLLKGPKGYPIRHGVQRVSADGLSDETLEG